MARLSNWRERFPGVSDAEWCDWRWQERHTLRTREEVERVFVLTEDERRGFGETTSGLRFAITPYYASLIDPNHPFCPVRMQCIPVRAEARRMAFDLRDPLGEEEHRPVRSLVHKYPDRVLLLATDRCLTYCRHCTRRRITSGEEGGFDRPAVNEAIAYVRGRPEVRDVLVSGGDPLTLSDDQLRWILAELRRIPHVQILRVATRAPVTCPMRIDRELTRLLRDYAPLFVMTHFNHPKECTPESQEACELLVDNGIPVENQTVLLRQVNSSARTILDLNHRLLSWRVRPYYLHQGDLAEGTAHLRTPLSCGIDVIERMRGHTSGLAVPHLAVDLPGGGGKVTVQPDYLLNAATRSATVSGSPEPFDLARGERNLGHGVEGPAGDWFRNYEGERYFYPAPPENDCSCPYDEVFYVQSPSPREGKA